MILIVLNLLNEMNIAIDIVKWEDKYEIQLFCPVGVVLVIAAGCSRSATFLFAYHYLPITASRQSSAQCYG